MSFADFRGDLRSCSGSAREILDADRLKYGFRPGCYKPGCLGPVGLETIVLVELKKEELSLLAAFFRLKSPTRSCPLYLKRRESGQLNRRCWDRPRDRQELFRCRDLWQFQCSVRKRRVSLIRASKETRHAEPETLSAVTGGAHSVR